MVTKKMFHLDVESTISKLTIDEKYLLLSGKDFWHTHPVPRLGIPSIRVSDGPNGVRGTRFFDGVPAACLPCGTALASTWDKSLIQSGGALMGHESIAKGSHVLLGPTMNTQRSPLGGRGFESYSEDPLLSGKIGAAVVEGIQSTGVSATVKHFVCNDQEDARQAVNAIVTERALREIYLMPFMITEREARPWCYMTAYNKLNGLHCSENPRLLHDVLRKEWGFDGLVMSDWFGTYSAAESIKAGLTLEMPGPPKARGEQVQIALNCGKLSQHDIDVRIRELLNLINRVMKTGIPENAPEKTIDTKETAQKLREIGGASQVLLKNENGALPFDKAKTVAVIGPNALSAAYSGGGSASLRPYYTISPLDGIKSQAQEVKYTLGCANYKALPLISDVCKTPNGEPGLLGKVYNEPVSTPSDKRKEVGKMVVDNSRNFLVDYQNDKLTSTKFYIDYFCTVTPSVSGDYIFGLVVAGTGKLYVDDKLLIDNSTHQTLGDEFFGSGSIEEKATISLRKDKTYNIRLEFGSGPTMTVKRPGATEVGSGGWRLGMVLDTDPEEDIKKAVELAGQVDQVVVIAGLSADWESEGYDRHTMDLPGLQDELIARVAKANPKTVVVMQSGTPVTMPWASDVAGVVQSWFGGNETGNAIADVLFGKINPSGKLSLTFPIRGEDNPAFLNFKNDKGRALYGEDVFVGYRFYEKTRREVRFPFGHGLSYTTFSLSSISVASHTSTSDVSEGGAEKITVDIMVKNTGSVSGAQVVQIYIAPRTPSITRPIKELKGFEKVDLKAGESSKVQVEMRIKDAVSFWDEQRDAWCVEAGVYDVFVGDSSANARKEGSIEVQSTYFWRGL